MTDSDARLLDEVLLLATSAANKLSVNRTVYKYPWMNQISAEVRALEDQAERLKAICAERGVGSWGLAAKGELVERVARTLCGERQRIWRGSYPDKIDDFTWETENEDFREQLRQEARAVLKVIG